jgi:coproporphyrinogen III oxidase-like Fe-S oxidoreductase
MRRTPTSSAASKKANSVTDEGRDADFFHLAIDLLEAGGFEHYEISNYAQPGHRSAHNESYWLGADYLGIGPGAFSTVEGRQTLAKRAGHDRYIALTLAGENTAVDVEVLTDENRRTERFGLELRTKRGLPLDLIAPDQHRMLDTLRDQGLLDYDEAVRAPHAHGQTSRRSHRGGVDGLKLVEQVLDQVGGGDHADELAAIDDGQGVEITFGEDFSGFTNGAGFGQRHRILFASPAPA